MHRKGTYMSTILKGAPVVAAMNEANAARCAALREKGVVPTLAVVRVGARPDDLSYEKGVMARCAKVGVEVKQFLLPADASQEELLRVIAGINADAAIHGCLLFRPLPKQFDDRTIRAALSPEKDIDGITDGSLAGVFTNTAVGYPPCTAQACLEILKFYNIPLSGRRAVVVGRSLVVGKPAAMMLDRENATVTLCNSRTQNLPEVCAFFDDFTRRYHKDSASAQAEEGCVREFLRDFAAYAPLAGLLRVNGRVAGFSAGEIVGDTLIIHIEKADIAYEGVYQALVNEYAKCFVTPGVRYINREEDAGDEGLRRSKESYHPVRLLEKYLVQIPAQPEKGDKSMQEVYEFLKKCGTYYLATVDGDQPRVRPFGTVNLFEGNLYIQTGKVKAVSREMTANPKVELCAFDGETWLRVSAKAVEDDRVQARQDLLDHYPELQSLYTADDGNTQVFALTEATATFSSFQAAPRVVRW